MVQTKYIFEIVWIFWHFKYLYLLMSELSCKRSPDWIQNYWIKLINTTFYFSFDDHYATISLLIFSILLKYNAGGKGEDLKRDGEYSSQSIISIINKTTIIDRISRLPQIRIQEFADQVIEYRQSKHLPIKDFYCK